ncbi:MAG: pitrilysin family protein [Bacteroidota bacterium]
MIDFKKFQLNNGLKVIVHEDMATPLVVVNILYDVGSRDEHPGKTGFAHLFEHLMFGGSVNIPCYDKPLEKAGGENNAFTSSDLTNYYLSIPSNNIETAFWLESDRMTGLAFSKKSLEVQRNVVIEEFKQTYLNQPYGDTWLLLKPLAYKVHPYQWSTIGKDISHIGNARMDDVKTFYSKYYCPNNAIMVLAGNIGFDEAKRLSEKWFGPIKPGEVPQRNLPVEPRQTKARKLTVKRDVSLDAIYKVYHTCARTDNEFYVVDLLSDILSSGNSSRLYKELVKNKKLFSDIDAYLSGDLDKGLFVISGYLVKGIKMEDAEAGIIEEINKIKKLPVKEPELTKVKNKIESTLLFSEINILPKAFSLAAFELLGDASMINDETAKYRAVTTEQIQQQANEIFRDTNCSTLYYLSKR